MTLEERVKVILGEQTLALAAAAVEIENAKAKIGELEKELAELKKRLPSE